MQSLDALVQQARTLADGAPAGAAEAEVTRQMQICNACRYCEGFCAVFPAMTRRLAFGEGDAHYLANLCHNCGACLHACQYAPPHAFAVNVPQAMARVRARTYGHYAWPGAMAVAYRLNGLLLALVLALALGLFLLLAAARATDLSQVPSDGNFYAVFPHGLMVALFLPVFAFVTLALAIGVRRFWRDQAPPADPVDTGAAARETVGNVLALTYLEGGHGEGCHNEDDRWTHMRRWMHHLTFYGFLLCFAATSLGTLYHYALGWVAPYDLPSLPKLLGTLGGLGLLAGPAGLFWLHLRRHPEHGDAAQRPMDLGFIALLFLTSLTGLGLWATRGVSGQSVWLALHLGVVMALFLTLPYGKFAHGVYRCAALLKFAIERRQPDRLRLGGD